jgi:diacylglycerol kinase family enzyme
VRYAVILNLAAGTRKVAAASARITEQLAAKGKVARITLVTGGTTLRQAARRAVAAGCDLLIAGGGDGTVHAGSRASLGRGQLAVYSIHAERRQGLLSLGWRIVLLGLEKAEKLDVLIVPVATVETRRPAIRVALDGELTVLQTPLEYRSLPGTLRVLAP